jgi:diguanylate cyclase (GGDEF)-like protein
LSLQYDLTIKQQCLAALAWVAFAALCLAASVDGRVVMLIWWPNGIAVGVLMLLPRRKWPFFITLAGLGGVLDNYLFGASLANAIGLAFANFAEAAVAAELAKRVLRYKQRKLLSLGKMFGLLGAAAAGALVSTAVMVLVQFETMTWYTAAWWCTTVTLGTLVSTPLVLALIDKLLKVNRLGTLLGSKSGRSGELLLLGSLSFLLSFAVLQEARMSLLFLPMALTIFAVTRYGHFGATVCLFAFSMAASIISFGGNPPAAFLALEQRRIAGLVLQAYMIVLLATSVPLASLLMAHDRLALRLKARNAKMRESLTWLGMAEEVARIGRWRYDPKTDTQDWSRQLFLINGIDRPRGGDPGDINHMLPDGGKEIRGLLKHHAQDRARYSFEFRIRTPQGDERILKMHLTNEFDEAGELKSRFGVVIDVTEHHQRQDALDKERTRAMRLAAEAQYLAHTDPLTGLANRRRTMTQLDKFIARCEVEARPLALILFDIDHFKQVNDKYGHQTGDDVLVRIADISRGEVRASDLIGRMGGEEFVWMLPDATLEEAANAAERLRMAIETGSHKDGLPNVTASIGYAMWQSGDDASSLLARADVALYEAKGAGRNKVQEAA